MKYFIFVMVVTITASVMVFSELTKAADAVYFFSLLKDEWESVKKGDYLTAIDALNTVLYCEQDSVVSWGFVEVYNGKTDTLYQYACKYNACQSQS